MTGADLLSLIFLLLGLLTLLDARLHRSAPNGKTLLQPLITLVMDHRIGWVFLAVAAAIQFWAGSLAT